MIYVIGSLRDEKFLTVTNRLRDEGIDVFDEWYAASPIADDAWRDYEKTRGWTYSRAIRESLAAEHIFQFDKTHLDRSNAALLVLPAGKSGHLELGYVIGSGKPGGILLDTPERWDVMYKFASVFDTLDATVEWAKGISSNE
jgi:hypothetical protein